MSQFTLHGHLGGVLHLASTGLGDTLVSVGVDRVAKVSPLLLLPQPPGAGVAGAGLAGAGVAGTGVAGTGVADEGVAGAGVAGTGVAGMCGRHPCKK